MKAEEWFNRSAHGHAGELCAKHPRGMGLDATEQAVFLAMASFAALAKRYPGTRSYCFASRDEIAKRAKMGRTSSGAALGRLMKHGAIERGQRVTGRDGNAGPVKWELLLLAESVPDISERWSESGHQSPERWSESDHQSPERWSESGREERSESGHESSHPSDPKGAMDDDRATAGAAGPGGPPLAVPSMGSASGSVEHVMAELGLSREAAQSWRERKLARTPGQEPIRNEPRWVESCITRELAQRATAGSTTNGKPATDTTPDKDTSAPPVRTFSMKPRPNVAASVPRRTRITVRHSPTNGTTS